MRCLLKYTLVVVLTLFSCTRNNADQTDGEGSPSVGNPLSNQGQVSTEPGGKMALFGSEDELRDYFKDYLTQQQNSAVYNFGAPESASDSIAPTSATMASAPANAKSASDDSITNNQTDGIEEGGIVQKVGDHFIVLRRGRLFSMAVGSDQDGELKHVDTEDLVPAGATRANFHAWYDELLVYDRKIIVIGFNTSHQATEIVVFRLADSGQIEPVDRTFLRSGDYYSGNNYASRLTPDGQLVLYMPVHFLNYQYVAYAKPKLEFQFPSQGRVGARDQIDDWRGICGVGQIYNPGYRFGSPVLHTVVTADLKEDRLSFKGHGVPGDFSRQFYVSASHVYLWIRTGGEEIADAVIFRFPLDGSGPSAVAVKGEPIDQFSFLDDGEHLNMLSSRIEYPKVVRPQSLPVSVEAPPMEVDSEPISEPTLDPAVSELVEVPGPMVDDEASAVSAAPIEVMSFRPLPYQEPTRHQQLVRIPIGQFGATPQPVPDTAYTELPKLNGYNVKNRFISDYLVYGEEGNLYSPDADSERLVIIPVKEPTKNASVTMTHMISRIEVMGANAVVMGPNREQGLTMSAIELAGEGKILGTHTLPNSSQAESRSHGFFYRDQTDGKGILGLPVVVQDVGRPVPEGTFFIPEHQQSASVKFLAVDAGTFKYLGELSSQVRPDTRDYCQVSCTDWYGSSRPIILADRIFALIGYELIEGVVSDAQDRIDEKSRLTFVPTAPDTRPLDAN